MKQNIEGESFNYKQFTRAVVVRLAKKTLGKHYRKAIQSRRKFHGICIYSDLPHNNPCFLSYYTEDYITEPNRSVFTEIETAERWMRALLKTMIA